MELLREDRDEIISPKGGGYGSSRRGRVYARRCKRTREICEREWPRGWAYGVHEAERWGAPSPRLFRLYFWLTPGSTIICIQLWARSLLGGFPTACLGGCLLWALIACQDSHWHSTAPTVPPLCVDFAFSPHWPVSTSKDKVGLAQGLLLAPEMHSALSLPCSLSRRLASLDCIRRPPCPLLLTLATGGVPWEDWSREDSESRGPFRSLWLCRWLDSQQKVIASLHNPLPSGVQIVAIQDFLGSWYYTMMWFPSYSTNPAWIVLSLCVPPAGTLTDTCILFIFIPTLHTAWCIVAVNEGLLIK